MCDLIHLKAVFLPLQEGFEGLREDARDRSTIGRFNGLEVLEKRKVKFSLHVQSRSAR